MTAYVDASVLLRKVLGEPDPLREWKLISVAVASELAEVECLRALDSLHVRGTLDDEEFPRLRSDVVRLIHEMELVEITRPILRRAAEPFSAALGTLDAIHLATALAWRERHDERSSFATHDGSLAAAAARAYGYEVLGSAPER